MDYFKTDSFLPKIAVIGDTFQNKKTFSIAHLTTLKDVSNEESKVILASLFDPFYSLMAEVETFALELLEFQDYIKKIDIEQVIKEANAIRGSTLLFPEKYWNKMIDHLNVLEFEREQSKFKIMSGVLGKFVGKSTVKETLCLTDSFRHPQARSLNDLWLVCGNGTVPKFNVMIEIDEEKLFLSYMF